MYGALQAATIEYHKSLRTIVADDYASANFHQRFALDDLTEADQDLREITGESEGSSRRQIPVRVVTARTRWVQLGTRLQGRVNIGQGSPLVLVADNSIAGRPRRPAP